MATTLIVDLTHPITGNSGSAVCVMAPTVTDFTVASASCLESEYTPTSKKVELQLHCSPTAGAFLLEGGNSFLLQVARKKNLGVLDERERAAPEHGVPRQRTVDRKYRLGHKLKIKGQATVAGPLTLQLKRGGWKTVAQGAATTASGSYTFTVKATQRGLYKFRVLFGGGNGYLGSRSKQVKVRVH